MHVIGHDDPGVEFIEQSDTTVLCHHATRRGGPLGEWRSAVGAADGEGLTRRYGAVPGQPLDRNGELIEVQQQVARAIEALGFLGLAGAWHLS